MKKLFIILLAVLGLFSLTCCATISTTAKSENLEVVPQSELENHCITDTRGQPIELQVGYITHSWRAVVKRTGIARNWWVEKNTDYTDETTPYLLLLKGKTSKGNIVWGCVDFHGDGTFTLYAAD